MSAGSTELATALAQPSPIVAQRLLGGYLERELDGQTLVGKIVETEAYDQHDVASHSYRGQTPRNAVMFGPAGFLYVYFTYGMHYCCNVVAGVDGHGAAVLLRALEPIRGQEIMQANRSARRAPDEVNLCNGPAKLCQAFGIDKRLNGHDLSASPLRLRLNAPPAKSAVVTTTRIGISAGQDVPWRFYLRGNKFVSRPL